MYEYDFSFIRSYQCWENLSLQAVDTISVSPDNLYEANNKQNKMNAIRLNAYRVGKQEKFNMKKTQFAIP